MLLDMESDNGCSYKYSDINSLKCWVDCVVIYYNTVWINNHKDKTATFMHQTSICFPLIQKLIYIYIFIFLYRYCNSFYSQLKF